MTCLGWYATPQLKNHTHAHSRDSSSIRFIDVPVELDPLAGGHGKPLSTRTSQAKCSTGTGERWNGCEVGEDDAQRGHAGCARHMKCTNIFAPFSLDANGYRSALLFVIHSSTATMSSAQDKVICALVLLKSSFRIAAARVRPHQPPEWKLCVQVSIPANVDPLTIVQQLCMVLGDVSLILVYQAEARSLLLRLYAYDRVVLVSPPSTLIRALHPSSVPAEWKALLAVYWQPAEMVYSYTQRSTRTTTDSEVLMSTSTSTSTSGLFEKYRYRPK